MIEDVLSLMNSTVVRYGEDGAYLCPVSAGTEGHFTVEVDTFHQLLIGRGFQMAGELLNNPEYTKTGDQLVQGVFVNMTPDGVLMPFQGAFYTGGMQMIFALLLDPHPLDIRSTEAALARGRTPWGVNTEQTTEEYRHWPWNDTKAAVLFSWEKMPTRALDALLNQKKWCSSLGAIPEKIRLDGYVIGYWYTTVHALLQWAICDALAYSRNGEVALAFGIDNRWQNFSAEGLCLTGNLNVSYRVEQGKLVSLSFRNSGTETASFRLSCNSCFAVPGLPETVTVPSGGQLTLL